VSSCFTLLRSKQALDMAFGKHFLIEWKKPKVHVELEC
jgi:hypothetical protein